MRRPKRVKLETYILRHKRAATKEVRILRFADSVGISAGEVRKWIDGYRSPTHERKRLIEKLTRGKITLYDW